MNWFALLGAVLVLIQAAPSRAAPAAGLEAHGYSLSLSLPDGRTLASKDLVGAILEMDDPSGRLVTARIDAFAPAPERADILLYQLSVQNPVSKAWGPMCDADIHGRRQAFPVPGRWEGEEHFVKDATSWFLTCTAGSQGKCILWGYDPWGRGPRGEDLAAYYQACQHMVHADYAGDGEPHTRNGTDIDIWDQAGLQAPDTRADPAFAFEAGWSATGAVCVARTRWSDLLPIEKVLAASPGLAATPCDEAEARRRGALLFNRSKLVPHAETGTRPYVPGKL